MSNVYFVTGGAGALGREIVGRLLCTDATSRVTLLLRARSELEADSRLDDIHRYVAKYFGVSAMRRLGRVRGDVTGLHLGMEREDYHQLTEQVTHVIHCAASTELGQPIDIARRINVEGTREVLRFAADCLQLAVLSHISTAYVAGKRDGVIREDELDEGQGFLNAYEQSKLEAEQLVHAAAPDLPILVFRPSIIVGDSVDGHLSCLSTIYRPLRAIVRRRVPITPDRASTRLDLVPVDYVADAIARLTTVPRRRNATYHVTSGWTGSIPMKDLVGFAIRFFGCDDDPPASFQRCRRTQCVPSELAVFFDYLGGKFGQKDFDDSNTRQDLGSEYCRPSSLDRVLSNLFAYCLATRWGKMRPWMEPDLRPIQDPPSTSMTLASPCIRPDNPQPLFDTSTSGNASRIAGQNQAALA